MKTRLPGLEFGLYGLNLGPHFTQSFPLRDRDDRISAVELREKRVNIKKNQIT